MHSLEEPVSSGVTRRVSDRIAKLTGDIFLGSGRERTVDIHLDRLHSTSCTLSYVYMYFLRSEYTIRRGISPALVSKSATVHACGLSQPGQLHFPQLVTPFWLLFRKSGMATYNQSAQTSVNVSYAGFDSATSFPSSVEQG